MAQILGQCVPPGGNWGLLQQSHCTRQENEGKHFAHAINTKNPGEKLPELSAFIRG